MKKKSADDRFGLEYLFEDSSVEQSTSVAAPREAPIEIKVLAARQVLEIIGELTQDSPEGVWLGEVAEVTGMDDLTLLPISERLVGADLLTESDTRFGDRQVALTDQAQNILTRDSLSESLQGLNQALAQ
jgi:hypothetical protein